MPPDLWPTGSRAVSTASTTIRLAASCSDPSGRPGCDPLGRPYGPCRDGAATTGGDPISRPGPDPIGRPQRADSICVSGQPSPDVHLGDRGWIELLELLHDPPTALGER
jgi:hypothetical protein